MATRYSERPQIEARFTNEQSQLSIISKALVDTGSAATCISEAMAEELHLKENDYTVKRIMGVSGQLIVKMYRVTIQIEQTIFRNHDVLVIPYKSALLGWDILENSDVLSIVTGTVFGQVINLLKGLPRFKEKT